MNDMEFDEGSCICNHMAEDHDLDGCTKLDCPCEARWE